MDHLASLRIFIQVSDFASFSRAAEALRLPKATVSSAIQELESRMGSRLLHRTTRRVQLTHDGLAFYERCRDVLADFDELEAMFQSGATQTHGRLRFDVPTGMAADLMSRLPEFQAVYPQVELEMSATDRRVDVLREGFDCVVRVGKLEDSALMARSLPDVALGNYASAAYVERLGRPTSIHELEKHQLIHYSPTFASSPDGFEYFDGTTYVTLPMAAAIVVNNTELLLEACLAGFGIMQAPAFGVRTHVADGSLIELLPDQHAESMPMSIIYPHRRNMARRVVAFIDWLAKTIKDYDPCARTPQRQLQRRIPNME